MTTMLESGQASAEEVIDLRKYIAVVSRAKWRILALAVLVSALTIFVVLNMQPVYSAKATLLIEAEQAKAVKIEEVYGINSAQQEYYLTQFEILKSRTIAESVIDRLNLSEHVEFAPKKNWKSHVRDLLPFLNTNRVVESEEDKQIRKREKLVTEFTSRLSIEPVRKTQLVNISFEANDAKLAADIANAVGEAYIDAQLAAKLGITQKANDWIGGRLGELRMQLDASEKALQDFRLREGLVDVAGVRSLGSQELERLGQEVTQMRTKKAQIDSFARVIRQYGTEDLERLESMPEVTSHPGVQNVKREMISAERKVSELSKVYGPKHPKLMAAKSELATVQQSLRDQIRRLLSGMTEEANTIEQNLASLESEMARAKGQYQDLSGKESEYQRLVREVETNRQLFDTFMARQKETEVAGDFNAAVARFTDRANTPIEPVKPNKQLIVVLAFIAAVGFGIVVAFVMDALNDTIKNTRDVETVLQQRALGIVPKVEGKKALADVNRTFFAADNKQFAESVRSIRTGLNLLGLERPIKVLMVTSSLPEEGKSTVSSNLAFGFRQLETVLLIDADMRKPTIAKRFGIPSFQPGLANYLSGTEALDACIVSDEQSTVDIMPAGSIPMNPLELLSSPALADLLTELRGRYSKIIIDTPPVQAVSDALVVAANTDATVMVVKADQTRSGIVQQSLAKLINAHTRVLGVVLNDVDLKLAERYYGNMGYYKYYADETDRG